MAVLEQITAALRGAHIAAGVAALATFSVPLVVRKGSRAHRTAGWIYVAAMYAAAFSAIGLAAVRMMQRPMAQWRMPVTFAYIAWISFTAAFRGTRVLRRVPATRVDVAVVQSLRAGALAMGAWGIATRLPLALAFALIGWVVGTSSWRTLRAAPATARERVLAHLSSMLVACITTLTAFTVTNARMFGLGGNLVVWLAPTLLGVPLIMAWQRRYARP